MCIRDRWPSRLTGPRVVSLCILLTVLVVGVVAWLCIWIRKILSPRCSAYAATPPPSATTTVYVDTMALRFITATPASLVRVTDSHPSAVVDTVSGGVSVDAIGVIGFNVQDRRGRWHYIELPDAHLCRTSSVELYPVQLAFAVHRARHFFDDVNETR